MPNPISHIALAWEVSNRIRNHGLNGQLGAYLLGSTSPDSRIITRSRREETHFAPLESIGLDAGVEGLFRAHPRLADASKLSPSTWAFIAGYLSHLIMDQVWITCIYRPFFGNRKVFENMATGNVMDRALQMDMDMQAQPQVQGLLPSLHGAEEGVEVGFISKDALRQWREWMEGLMERGVSWDRLRFIARRHLQEETPAIDAAVEEFLQSGGRGVEQIYDKVPRERVAEFKEQAIQEFIRVAQRYLPCD